MNTPTKSTIVQIGVGATQTGRTAKDDDMYTTVSGLETSPDLLLLVEPNPVHIKTIESRYKALSNLDFDNVRIENIAISTNDEKEVNFYYHPDDTPFFEVASLDPDHICKHRDFKAHELEVIKVPTMTVASLFDKYEIKEVDLLIMDTEGMDDTILKTIDFSKYKIKRLLFENCHLKDAGIHAYLKTQGFHLVDPNHGEMGWNSFMVSKDLVK